VLCLTTNRPTWTRSLSKKPSAGVTDDRATGMMRALQEAQSHLATKDELRKMELRLRWQIPPGTATIVAAILALYQFAG
jgi:hypothetical protein